MGQMELIERSYRHPTRPGLGVEVLDYRDLISRLPASGFGQLHRLDFHQLLLVNDGHATAMVDFAELPCTPGTLLHTRPGQVQRLPTRHCGERPAEIDATLVLFTAAFPAHSPHTAPVVGDPFGQTAFQLAPADHAVISHSFADLATESCPPSAQTADLDVELLQHLLAALLLRIARLTDPRDLTAIDSDCFHRFRHELERSYTVLRRAQSYADRLGYSLKTLNRACQHATGHTAKEIIDDRVVLEAKRLLAHTDLPAVTIGSRLGFTEPTNFGKFFALRTQTTPAAFRRTQQHPAS